MFTFWICSERGVDGERSDEIIWFDYSHKTTLLVRTNNGRQSTSNTERLMVNTIRPTTIRLSSTIARCGDFVNIIRGWPRRNATKIERKNDMATRSIERTIVRQCRRDVTLSRGNVTLDQGDIFRYVKITA